MLQARRPHSQDPVNKRSHAQADLLMAAASSKGGEMGLGLQV